LRLTYLQSTPRKANRHIEKKSKLSVGRLNDDPMMSLRAPVNFRTHGRFPSRTPSSSPSPFPPFFSFPPCPFLFLLLPPPFPPRSRGGLQGRSSAAAAGGSRSTGGGGDAAAALGAEVARRRGGGGVAPVVRFRPGNSRNNIGLSCLAKSCNFGDAVCRRNARRKE